MSEKSKRISFPKKCGNMYFSEITINAKAADKLPNYRSIILFPSHPAVATISATCKLCAAPVIARKNTTSIPDSIDVMIELSTSGRY
jgi:hypothetical protein